MGKTKQAQPTIEERFRADVARHEMAVLHNDGVYRHLRFKRPNTFMYHFDVVTWPGYLTITGDMDTFTFARTEDMLAFFREGAGINPGYWGEKVKAGAYKRYDEDYAHQAAVEYLDEWAEHEEPERAARVRQQLQELIEDTDSQGESEFRYGLSRIGDPFGDWWWESDLHPHTFQFLWCCWAIRHAVTTFAEVSL